MKLYNRSRVHPPSLKLWRTGGPEVYPPSAWVRVSLGIYFSEDSLLRQVLGSSILSLPPTLNLEPGTCEPLRNFEYLTVNRSSQPIPVEVRSFYSQWEREQGT